MELANAARPGLPVTWLGAPVIGTSCADSAPGVRQLPGMLPPADPLVKNARAEVTPRKPEVTAGDRRSTQRAGRAVGRQPGVPRAVASVRERCAPPARRSREGAAPGQERVRPPPERWGPNRVRWSRSALVAHGIRWNRAADEAGVVYRLRAVGNPQIGFQHRVGRVIDLLDPAEQEGPLVLVRAEVDHRVEHVAEPVVGADQRFVPPQRGATGLEGDHATRGEHRLAASDEVLAVQAVVLTVVLVRAFVRQVHHDDVVALRWSLV